MQTLHTILVIITILAMPIGYCTGWLIGKVYMYYWNKNSRDYHKTADAYMRLVYGETFTGTKSTQKQ